MKVVDKPLTTSKRNRVVPFSRNFDCLIEELEKWDFHTEAYRRGKSDWYLHDELHDAPLYYNGVRPCSEANVDIELW